MAEARKLQSAAHIMRVAKMCKARGCMIRIFWQNSSKVIGGAAYYDGAEFFVERVTNEGIWVHGTIIYWADIHSVERVRSRVVVCSNHKIQRIIIWLLVLISLSLLVWKSIR